MKFFKLIKLYFQRNFVFRLNFAMSWGTTILKFLFTILFWLCAMNNTSYDFLYSNKEMFIYFFVIMLIGLFIESDVTGKVANSIFYGNLVTDILKPISHHTLYFTNTIAMKLFLFAAIVCISVILVFIPSYSNLFVVSLLVSFFINFEMNYLIGLFAFWTNTVWGISMVNTVLIDVFGGRLFPIALSGLLMKKICAYLPYQYIYYVPTQILEQKFGFEAILMQLTYAFILFFVSKIVFKCGLKRFEAVGV